MNQAIIESELNRENVIEGRGMFASFLDPTISVTNEKLFSKVALPQVTEAQ